MSEAPSVTAARIDVERRRGAMMDTVHLLQARLAPRTLAADTWEKAKSKGADLAEDAVDAVRARPVAAGGVAAAIALFLAREPLRQAAGKIYDAMTSRRDTNHDAEALTPTDRPDLAALRDRERTSPKTEIVT